VHASDTQLFSKFNIMKKSTKIITALALIMALSTMAFSSIASADDSLNKDGEFDLSKLGEKHQKHQENMTDEQKTTMGAMKAAIESGDYETWCSLHQEVDHPRSNTISELITEENFDTFASLMTAKAEKDLEAVKELMTELGIEKGIFPHRGHKRDGKQNLSE